MVGLSILVIVGCMVTLSGCDASKDFAIIVDIDASTTHIYLDGFQINEDAEVPSPSFQLHKDTGEGDKYHIEYDGWSSLSDFPNSINAVLQYLRTLIPECEVFPEHIEGECEPRAYGFEKVGRVDYYMTYTSDRAFAIPITFVSDHVFTLNGQKATLLDGRYVLETDIVQNENEPGKLLISLGIQEYDSCITSIDLTQDPPKVTHTFTIGSLSESDRTKWQTWCQQSGMTLESMSDNKVVVEDAIYGSHEEFRRIFAERYTTWFGISTLIEKSERKQFIFDKGHTTFSFHNIFDAPVILEIKAPEGAKFKIADVSDLLIQEQSSRYLRVAIDGRLRCEVSFSSFNATRAARDTVALLGMIFVAVVMVVLIRKKAFSA